MSEQHTPYESTLEKFVSYRKNEFNLGCKRIKEIRTEWEKWDEILSLIKHAERKYQTETENARMFYDFEQLRKKYILSAESAKAASLRLRKYLINKMNDFSL